MYIYIYIERERDMSIYIYIYIAASDDASAPDSPATCLFRSEGGKGTV